MRGILQLKLTKKKHHALLRGKPKQSVSLSRGGHPFCGRNVLEQPVQIVDRFALTT